MSEEDQVTLEIKRLWEANPDAIIHISGGQGIDDMNLNTKRLFLSDLRSVLGLNDDQAEGGG